MCVKIDTDIKTLEEFILNNKKSLKEVVFDLNNVFLYEKDFDIVKQVLESHNFEKMNINFDIIEKG